MSGADEGGPHLETAVRVLVRGEILIYPTDTLYAFGGRALDAGAVARVRAGKGREAGKALPVIAADLEQARGLAAAWPEGAERLARAFWPGPLTLVVAAAPGLPQELTAGLGTVAVRVPALPLARALCRAAGPLVSTSANAAGEPPAITCAQAVSAVGAAASVALDAGPGGSTPSTIVDVRGAEPRLLREGAVPWSAIRGVLLSPSPC